MKVLIKVVMNVVMKMMMKVVMKVVVIVVMNVGMKMIEMKIVMKVVMKMVMEMMMMVVVKVEWVILRGRRVLVTDGLTNQRTFVNVESLSVNSEKNAVSLKFKSETTIADRLESCVSVDGTMTVVWWYKPVISSHSHPGHAQVSASGWKLELNEY